MSDTPFSDSTSSTADVVTAVNFTGTTLTLTKQAGDDLTTTISSSPQVVTGLTYNAENDDKLKLTQSAGQGSYEVTIPSGGLPYAFAQTDDTASISATNYNRTPLPGFQLTDLTQSITPTSSSQKVVIQVSVFGAWSSTSNKGSVILERKIGTADATIIEPQNHGNRYAVGGMFALTLDNTSSSSSIYLSNFVFVDSPDTTDQVTYRPRVAHRDNINTTFYLNRTGSDTNHIAYARGFSTMTLECKNV
jgi:hypothetical protein